MELRKHQALEAELTKYQVLEAELTKYQVLEAELTKYQALKAKLTKYRALKAELTKYQAVEETSPDPAVEVCESCRRAWRLNCTDPHIYAGQSGGEIASSSRAFPCLIRLFCGLASLLVHQATHAGSLPKPGPNPVPSTPMYICDCGEEFSDFSVMMEHKRSHVSEEQETQKLHNDEVNTLSDSTVAPTEKDDGEKAPAAAVAAANANAAVGTSACELPPSKNTGENADKKESAVQVEGNSSQSVGVGTKSIKVEDTSDQEYENELRVTCECGMGFTSPKLLLEHLQKHAQESYTCPTCGVTVNSWADYEIHLQLHMHPQHHKRPQPLLLRIKQPTASELRQQSIEAPLWSPAEGET
uniref:C2H2-type domain-containing protein n=1 Tax=Knipowitschia caucasica TaxID=637954 RepID=A0AAV2MDR3_KNICA